MRPERLTTFEYALLGLVSLAPMSGYDVQRVFATTPLAHYSSSPGSIYPALKRLARAGLLQETIDRTSEMRPKRVYSLAEAGERALEGWLRQAPTRDELLSENGAAILRFSLMEGRLSQEEVQAYLAALEGVLEEYLRELRGHRTQLAQVGATHHRLALEEGISGYRAFAEWTRYARRVLLEGWPEETL